MFVNLAGSNKMFVNLAGYNKMFVNLAGLQKQSITHKTLKKSDRKCSGCGQGEFLREKSSKEECVQQTLIE